MVKIVVAKIWNASIPVGSLEGMNPLASAHHLLQLGIKGDSKDREEWDQALKAMRIGFVRIFIVFGGAI